MNPRFRALALLLPSVLLACLASGTAAAQTVRVAVIAAHPGPVRVVVQRPHRRVYVRPRVTIVRRAAPTLLAVERVDPGPVRMRDPYATGGVVVVGGGIGGAFFFGDGVTHVAPAYKLHLGLAVDQAEFRVAFDLIPEAPDVQIAGGGSTPAALYTMGAGFSYRFLPGADVHPVAGVGVEAMVLDPHQGETGTAFALTARVGLELAYPISDGALALGLDVTGHRPFGATESFAATPTDMITFGAYGNYRF